MNGVSLGREVGEEDLRLVFRSSLGCWRARSGLLWRM